MKTLIVYFSFTGNNELLASDLSSRIDSDILRITEKKGRGMFRTLFDVLFDRRPKLIPLKINWRLYQHVVLMAPIWNKQIAHPMKSFIEKEAKSHLLNYSFMTLCTGREGQEESIREQLDKMVGRPPEVVQEIRVIDLLPADKQKDAKAIGEIKITEKTIQQFSATIENFVDKIRKVEPV